MAADLTQRRRAAEVAKVRLGEVCEIARIESLREASVWLLNLDMVEQQTGRVIQKLFVSQADLWQSVVAFDERCVLYSKLRPNLNKVVLPDSDGYASSELLPLLPDEAICQREYLAAFLRSDGFVRYATTKAFGAKMPRLGSKDLMSAVIPLPPLAEQKRIAAKLDAICEIVSKREEQLKKLDQLVKSRFVEMFGDVSTNTKSWTVVELGDVLVSIGNGKSFVCESFPRMGDAPAILKLSAATWGVYKPEENKALKPGSKFYPECEVRNGDLLFTRKNTFDLVGMCAYVRKTPPNLMLPDLIFRLETNDKIDV